MKSPFTIDSRCGTYAGYNAHQYRKEDFCPPCREARTMYIKKWTKANSRKVKRYNKKWTGANTEKVRASCVRYSARYPEKTKKRHSEYRSSHPEKRREHDRRRRARKRDNGFEPYTEAQVLEIYGTDCYLCGEPIDLTAPRQVGKVGWERGLHIEHLVAIANGGRDDLENARPSHGLCNCKKGARAIYNYGDIVELLRFPVSACHQEERD